MSRLVFLFILLALAINCTLSASVFDTKRSKENDDAIKNTQIKCRWVCDKKIYKEQKISEAIEFYKNSKEYHFSSDAKSHR